MHGVRSLDLGTGSNVPSRLMITRLERETEVVTDTRSLSSGAAESMSGPPSVLKYSGCPSQLSSEHRPGLVLMGTLVLVM